MIDYIHSATVLVSDQDRALAFYTDVLGWEKREDNPFEGGGRWLTVAPSGAKTTLVLGQPELMGQPRPDGSERHTGISLIAGDVQATYDALKARGVTFTQAPERMPWGALATWFSDPDGNTFFLTEEQGG